MNLSPNRPLRVPLALPDWCRVRNVNPAIATANGQLTLRNDQIWVDLPPFAFVVGRLETTYA
jgi:hypothetical protein